MCTLISGSCTSYTIVGGVVLGASWYLYRLAMGPTSEFLNSLPVINKPLTLLLPPSFTVQWTKSNPTPWNSIKPNQSTKIMTVNHDAEK